MVEDAGKPPSSDRGAVTSELYDALLSAGAPEDKARKAAESVAEHRFAKIESTQRLHTWILTFNTAMLAIIVGKLFIP